jgi:rhodanese-related sulfurtransferase
MQHLGRYPTSPDNIMALRIPKLFGFTSVLSLLISLCAGDIVELTAQQFYQRAFVDGSVDAIVDVRTRSEWETGHIEGALFLENLGDAGTSNEITSLADLAGCEYCEIIVYCQSGNRAGRALLKLEAAGFQKLSNGQGTVQWTGQSYSLVTTPSVAPGCTTDTDKSATCQAAFEAELASEITIESGETDQTPYGETYQTSYAVGTPCFPGMGLVATLWVVWMLLL